MSWLKLPRPLRALLKIKDPDRLFSGDDAMFKRSLKGCTVYGEYGCGASTLWVARHVPCRILSVDTSSEWVQKVRQECTPLNVPVQIHHADLGPVGAWGRPVAYDFFDRFAEYTDFLWQQPVKPDLVLVDGRFRVCCFLTTLLHADPGTTVLFDDYMNRTKYHFVERHLKPVETCGRQARFVVPSKEALNLAQLQTDVDRFRFVMD